MTEVKERKKEFRANSGGVEMLPFLRDNALPY